MNMRMMVLAFLTLLATTGMVCADAEQTSSTEETEPILQDEPSEQQDPPFEEIDGFLAVEAEHYHERLADNPPRDWYLISADSVHPLAATDHSERASNKAYLEVLPDTRVTHDDELIAGTNFFPDAGASSILSYNVWFNTPGEYIVWARAYSTGTEDNGLHAGLNGTWPERSQRIQWCDGKRQWTWSSAQRVPENHCGTPRTIHLEIEEAGLHTIQFSMREDGFEFDKWIMTLDTLMIPKGIGPSERRRQ